jgi:hypothetical protein
VFLILVFAGRAWADDDFCFTCHQTQEGTSKTFKNDVHYTNTISCADCHGGDPKVNDMNQAKTAAKGFRLRVQRQDVPTFCAGCHSNAKFMTKFKANEPTNQIALYERSIHGMKFAAGNTKAAECIDCHGIHDIRPISDPNSPVNARNNSTVCVKCHADEANLLRQNRAHAGRTSCVSCHTGGHDIQKATTALLTGPQRGCGACHRGNSRQAQTANQMAQLLTNLENAGPASADALAAAAKAAHSFNTAAMQRAIAANPPKPAAASTQPTTRP